MAVAWGAAGTGASGGTSCTPSYPTGISSSTSKIYCVAWSGASSEPTPTMPAGWTQVGTFSGGNNVTYAADAGKRRVTFFKKDTVSGSESGSVTVSLSSGDTLRAVIFRVEVTSGYQIKEHFASGADTSAGTSFSAAASSNLPWAANQLLLIAVAQCTDTATQGSQAISASSVTFGTRTNRESTAVTNGNDHRAIMDSVPVSSVSPVFTQSAPTYSYTASGTNSANTSGPAGFLLLEEQITDVAAKALFRAAVTNTKDPNLGPARTVQRFSRMSLVRGIGARKIGAFQFSSPTTDVAGKVVPRGTETSLKSTSWGDTAALLFRASTSSGPAIGGTTSVAGQALQTGSSSATKKGQGDEAARALPAASSSATKSTTTTAAAAIAPKASTTHTARVRTIGTWSRMSLIRGLQTRRAGDFSRQTITSGASAKLSLRAQAAGAKLQSGVNSGVLLPRATCTAQKIATAAVSARTNVGAAETFLKIGFGTAAGVFSRGGTETFSHTGIFAEAGRLWLLGATAYTRDGRSILRYTRLSVALVATRKSGSFQRSPGAILYGKFLLRGQDAAGKRMSIDIAAAMQAHATVVAGKFTVVAEAGRAGFAAAETSQKSSSWGQAAALLARATSTGQSITGPTYDMRGRVLAFGVSTAAKTLDEDTIGAALFRSSATASKTLLSGAATGRLPSFAASTTSSFGPKVDIRCVVFPQAATSAVPVVLPAGRGRLSPHGASTFEKLVAAFDDRGRLLALGSTSAQKIMTGGANGLAPTFRAKTTTAAPVVRGRTGGARPSAIGASRPPSRGTSRPPNR